MFLSGQIEDMKAFFFVLDLLKKWEKEGDYKTICELHYAGFNLWDSMEKLKFSPHGEDVTELASNTVATINSTLLEILQAMHIGPSDNTDRLLEDLRNYKTSSSPYQKISVPLQIKSKIVIIEKQIEALENAVQNEAKALKRFYVPVGVLLLTSILVAFTLGLTIGLAGASDLVKGLGIVGLLLCIASAMLLLKMKASDYIATLGGRESMTFIQNQWLPLLLLVLGTAMQTVSTIITVF